MATENPFASLGLGNMGRETGILSTAGDAFKNVLAGQLAKGIGVGVGGLLGGDNQLGAALMNPATYGTVPTVPAMSAPSPQMNPNPPAPVLQQPQLPALNQTVETPDPTASSYTRFLFPAK